MILVVRKNSTLDRHGDYIRDKVNRGFLSHEHLDRLSRAHEEHYKTFEDLMESLSKAKLPFQEVHRDESWPSLDSISYVITVGGDGTVLEASHHISNADVALIGIKSSPSSIGYLCYKSASQISELISELKSDHLSLIQVSRLNATIHRVKDGQSFVSNPVLNDFLFTAANPAETSRYRITLGGNQEVQKSSGIWIATAAGSTAAISAAGGSIHPINDPNFQYLVREPYASPGKSFKLVGGNFHPDQQTFELENLVDQGILALDGHHGILSLGYGDRVVFGSAPSLKLARTM